MKNLKEKSTDVLIVSATYDKDTKRTWRYSIEENKKGISGTIYLNKDKHPSPTNTIKIKIRIEERE